RRRLVRTLTDRNNLPAAQVAFSSVRNLLAATSEPRTVTLYDLDSGQESILWRAPDQGEWEVHDLTFSQDGSKVVIYAASQTENLQDEVWVLNASSSEIESRHPARYSNSPFQGAALLSPDNRRLYLTHSANDRTSIRCIDLATGQELWQTE